jgi:hypothetical protein
MWCTFRIDFVQLMEMSGNPVFQEKKLGVRVWIKLLHGEA